MIASGSAKSSPQSRPPVIIVSRNSKGNLMRYIMAAALTLCLANTVVAEPATDITVTRAGSQTATAGSADNFTGSAHVLSRFKGTEPSRMSGGIVHFEAGARTAWHTHPLGQTLIVTEGEGRVQQWGGPIEVIKVGDVVWIPPGVKHWHGAAPNAPMTHVAVTEMLGNKTVDWMEKVTAEQARE